MQLLYFILGTISTKHSSVTSFVLAISSFYLIIYPFEAVTVAQVPDSLSLSDDIEQLIMLYFILNCVLSVESLCQCFINKKFLQVLDMLLFLCTTILAIFSLGVVIKFNDVQTQIELYRQSQHDGMESYTRMQFYSSENFHQCYIVIQLITFVSNIVAQVLLLCSLQLLEVRGGVGEVDDEKTDVINPSINQDAKADNEAQLLPSATKLTSTNNVNHDILMFMEPGLKPIKMYVLLIMLSIYTITSLANPLVNQDSETFVNLAYLQLYLVTLYSSFRSASKILMLCGRLPDGGANCLYNCCLHLPLAMFAIVINFGLGSATGIGLVNAFSCALLFIQWYNEMGAGNGLIVKTGKEKQALKNYLVADLNEIALKKEANIMQLQPSQYSMPVIAIYFKYQLDPDSTPVPKNFELIGLDSETATFKEYQDRVSQQEISINFLLSVIVFVIQMTFIAYLYMQYLGEDFIFGTFQVNIIRLSCAIILHMKVLPETNQSIGVMKFALARDTLEGKHEQFLIACFQLMSAVGTEVVNLLYMCTKTDAQEIIVNTLFLTFIIEIDDMFAMLQKNSFILSLIKHFDLDTRQNGGTKLRHIPANDTYFWLAAIGFYKVNKTLYYSIYYYFMPFFVLFIPVPLFTAGGVV